jgi:leucyl/phenylalanyl-tRNA--protein transferase
LKGEELNADLLRYAYSRGVFPMTMEHGEIGWFQPYKRALFPIEGIHVSHSLRKTIHQGKFEFQFDCGFSEVMEGCFRPDDNWLSEHFVRAYTEAFDEGWAHCCSVWLDGSLVGGIYGLALGTCFSAESMFHRVTDASKVALWAMVEKCREVGFTVFDAQVMNPHLKSLGAFEIPHEEYMRLLDRCLRSPNKWG